MADQLGPHGWPIHGGKEDIPHEATLWQFDCWQPNGVVGRYGQLFFRWDCETLSKLIDEMKKLIDGAAGKGTAEKFLKENKPGQAAGTEKYPEGYATGNGEKNTPTATVHKGENNRWNIHIEFSDDQMGFHMAALHEVDSERVLCWAVRAWKSCCL